MPDWIQELSASDWAVIAMGIAGLILGATYTLTSWSSSLKGSRPTGKTSAISDPRIKNLIYLLTGALAIFIANWEKMLGETPPNRLGMIAAYIILFGITAVIVFYIIFIRIRSQTKEARDSAHGQAKVLLSSAITDFLFHGYPAYLDTLKKTSEEGANQRIQQLEQSIPAIAAAFAGLLTALEREQAKTEPELSDTIRNILVQACTVVRLLADPSDQEKLKLNANIMVSKEYSKIPQGNEKLLRFTFGDPSRYSHALFLKEYAKPSGKEEFGLPVDGQGHPNTRLPGAPEAFNNAGSKITNVEKIVFSQNIPKKIINEIRDYFKNKEFLSFLSIAIIHKGEPRGVLNVESNLRNSFDAPGREDMIVQALLPFTELLGRLISQDQTRQRGEP